MAHPDFDELLNVLIPFAQQQLQQHGGFFPFGATVTSAGEVVCNAGYDKESAEAAELIELLTEAFRRDAAAGTIRTAALCYDGRTVPPGKSKKTDAICIRMENREDRSSTVFLPYRKGWFGRISYGELFAAARERQFFL